MPEQQVHSSEPSRILSTDNPKHQTGTNMDWKFQENMYMPYNLISKMVTPNGKMLQMLKLSRSKIPSVQGHRKVEYEKVKVINASKGHQKIRVNFVFHVKHSGQFKAWLVTDGHLTKDPTETVYSGVFSLRNLRLDMSLTELNNLQLWGADDGNPYLQAVTKEKLNIVAGPEFEELQGFVLVMN